MLLDKDNINKADFELQVNAKAFLLLGDSEDVDNLTEVSFKYFSEEAQRIANACVQKYVFALNDYYTKGDFAIKDSKILSDFKDFNTGYQSQMLKWIKENKLTKDVKIELTNEPTKENTISVLGVESHIPSLVGGILMLIACAFVIYECETWLILTVGFLSAIVSFVGSYLSRREKNTHKNEDKWKTKYKRYLIENRNKRTELVRGVINDLKGWLDKAQEESERILAQFGINRSVSKL